MSQLLSRISSSSVLKKQRLCFSRPLSTAAAAGPYLFLGETIRGRSECGGKVVDVELYDPRKEERVKIPSLTLPNELKVSTGSWRGWFVTYDDSAEKPNALTWTKRVYLTNMYNPGASVSSHKVISLPPLANHGTGVFNHLSLSASPDDDDEDCVVAVMPSLQSLSLCRPGDSEWTCLKPPVPAREIVYSDRDRCFYLQMLEDYCKTNISKRLEAKIQLFTSSSAASHFPQLRMFKTFPTFNTPQSKKDETLHTFNRKRLVESPDGDSFIVYMCSYIADQWMKWKPRTFMVYRQDHDQKKARYTQDIGDLCIFLGGNESFCLSASQYPGLKPNSVYYAQRHTGFGYYELSSDTLHEVVDPSPLNHYYHWLAPPQSRKA